MPRYAFFHPGEGVTHQPGDVKLHDVPVLTTANMNGFEELIRPKFHYIRTVFDPIADIRHDWETENDEVGFPGNADDVIYNLYGENKASDNVDNEEAATKRFNTLAAFVHQAHQPGDQLVKVMPNTEAGDGIFILCNPAEVPELKRLLVMASRMKVAKELE
jgi:hypothetical protein